MQNEKLQKEQLEQLKSSLVMFRSITIFFLLVVALGTLIFHIIEKWSWLDSIYFVVVTVATVGYGNLVPTSDI
ncbi:MAG: potassium channel family protein, partial [Candidatus Saccharibacteria bacterium]